MLNPGDVVVLVFPGANDNKRRPGVVASTSNYHQCRPDAVISLLTSQVHKATTEMDCTPQDWQQAGLRQPSAYRSYFVTVDIEDLTPIGKLSDRDWQEVQSRLSRAIAASSLTTT